MNFAPVREPPLCKGAMLAGGKRLSPTESKMRRGPRKRWRDCNKLPQLQYLGLFESLLFNNPSVTS